MTGIDALDHGANVGSAGIAAQEGVRAVIGKGRRWGRRRPQKRRRIVTQGGLAQWEAEVSACLNVGWWKTIFE